MPIFDQGYQHWSGTLSGHTWRWLTVTRHGVRIGMKNVFLRLLIVFSWLPAAALAFVLCVWGLIEQKSDLAGTLKPVLAWMFSLPLEAMEPKSMRVEVWTISFDYFLWFQLNISMIVVLLVGPALISQDLRFNALPLYYSRPLRRIDYFIGKLGVVGWFLSLVTIIPPLMAYGLGLLFSRDITIIRDTYQLLLTCLAYGAITVLSAGTLILALSSLSRNSRYIALFWIALWFVSTVVGLTLNAVDLAFREHRQQQKMREVVMRRPPRPVQGQPGVVAQAPPNRFNAPDEEMQALMDEAGEEEAQASLSNWRWLPSYTANLARMREYLLQYNEAWEKVAEYLPANHRREFLRQPTHLGPMYPWYWSAVVLAFLFGISVCILNLRIRSLDRLK